MADESSFDPFAVLGLEPGASQDEIHAAYRRRSRSAHPDAGGRDEDFRRLRQAYEALTGGAPVGSSIDAGAPDRDRDQDREQDRDQDLRAGARPPSRASAPSARHTAPSAVGPRRSSRSGCVVGALVVLLLLFGVVALAVVVGSSGSAPDDQRARGTPAPPVATGPDAMARWRDEHQALVTAIVANGTDIGAALSASSGTVRVDALQEACARRRRLLDELAGARPTPRDDVTAAVERFVASERRAMTACLASPPDLDGLANEGARGQADLRTIVQATQP